MCDSKDIYVWGAELKQNYNLKDKGYNTAK